MIFMRIPIDVIGDIAILKFSRRTPLIYKKYYAWRLIKKNKHIKVVVEKTSGFSGELRTQSTGWLFGEKRKDTIHKENGCLFKLNIDEVYFSSRLSEDRKLMTKDILDKIKNNDKVLVMFSGISVFPIVLARELKKNKINAKIISSELNKKACAFGEENIKLNKVSDVIEIIEGDSRVLCDKFSKKKEKFDFIVMLRPNLEDSFIGSAMKVSKKGTIVFYHGFGTKEFVDKEIERDAKISRKKISDLLFRKSGDISVRDSRWSVSFFVK